LRDDFLFLFEGLFHHRLDLQRLNYAIAVLVPKKEKMVRVSDLRPISLLNRSFKIVTNILANRLGPLLDDLIDPTYSGFISGCNIHDSIATTHEMIFWSKIARDECFLLKLDFEKAYDSVL